MKILLLSITLLLFFGCNKGKNYPVRGTIIEVRKKSHEFLIHHDEIPGFMMAMTMPFTVKDSTDIGLYLRGDSVHFYLNIDGDKTLASNFELQGKGTLPNNDDDWDDEYTPLESGEILATDDGWIDGMPVWKPLADEAFADPCHATNLIPVTRADLAAVPRVGGLWRPASGLSPRDCPRRLRGTSTPEGWPRGTRWP